MKGAPAQPPRPHVQGEEPGRGGSFPSGELWHSRAELTEATLDEEAASEPAGSRLTADIQDAESVSSGDIAAASPAVTAAVIAMHRWNEVCNSLAAEEGGAAALDALLLALGRLCLEAGDGALPAAAAVEFERALEAALRGTCALRSSETQ